MTPTQALAGQLACLALGCGSGSARAAGLIVLLAIICLIGLNPFTGVIAMKLSLRHSILDWSIVAAFSGFAYWGWMMSSAIGVVTCLFCAGMAIWIACWILVGPKL